MATVRLLVFANCQANPLASTINMISPDIEIIRCPAVHTISKDQTASTLELISTADIIVHQPISDSFGVISSDSLRAEFPNKEFISFTSIYFGGLCPQLQYLRLPSGGTLSGVLTEYHDTRIIHGFLRGFSVQECADRISSDESNYSEVFMSAITELRRRDQGVDIPVAGIIEQGIVERPCLYTFNHPDNQIILQVAQNVVMQLGVSIDVGVKGRIKPFLDNVSAAIPPSIPKMLGATWSRENYVQLGEHRSNIDLVEKFYKQYEGCDDFLSLYKFNQVRENIKLTS